MTQNNTLNAKLSNSQLDKLKPGIKNCNEIIFNLSSNLIVNYNDAINLPHKLLLIDTQVSSLHKAFTSGLSANVKF